MSFGQNKIYLGDSVDVMKKIDSNSVHLTVTSPPYDNLRTYNGKIKDNISFDEFSFPFVDMVKELYRITADGGIVVWVVNDQVKNGGETGSSFKQALKFQELGFKIYDTMIYHKNGASFPETGRYSQVFEYMFVFLKGKKPRVVNLLKDKKNKWAGVANFGQRSIRQKDGSLKKSNNFIVSDYGYRYNVWYINNGAGYTTKDKYAHAHPACVDVETECLTIDGWKKYDELKINDKVLSYDLITDSLEWDKIKNIYINNFKGEVSEINSRRLSMLVTHNHRNVIECDNKIGIVETKDLKNRHKIITACYKNKNKNNINENLAYLLGMILTDGYFCEKSKYIGITQNNTKNKHKVDKILKCLDNLKLKYTFSEYIRYYHYEGEKNHINMRRIKKEDIYKYNDIKECVYLDIRIWDYNDILKMIPNKKITKLLFELDNSSILKILDGIIDGDGHVRKKDKSYVVTGKDKEFHENLQILGVLGGYTSDYIEFGNYTQLTKQRYKLLRNSNGKLLKNIKYDGVVWCPEVERNGTWVAKRNNKIFITGNSFPESLAEDHILSWSNEGDVVLDPMCGAGTTCKMSKLNNRNFIGIDIDEEYVAISNRRVDEVVPYSVDNLNEKLKFIVSREEILANRARKKK